MYARIVPKMPKPGKEVRYNWCMPTRIKKALRVLTWAAAFILAADIAFVLAMSWYQPPTRPADAAVVLGAAIGTPALRNRTLVALELYNRGLVKEIVLSGGRVRAEDISEAGYSQKVILKNSSTTPPLLLDEDSGTTYENLRNTKRLLGGTESIIVVSDRFHLARAYLVARRAGFSDVQWAGPAPYYYGSSELAYYYAREMVALLWYAPRLVIGGS